MALHFYKGNENILKRDKDSGNDEGKQIENIQKAFSQVLDTKNLSFFLGSGCSSFENKNDKQIGIPTMAALAEEFYNLGDFKEQRQWLKEELKIDVDKDNFKDNLENFLSTLHSLSFYHLSTLDSEKEKELSQKAREEDFVDLKCCYAKIKSIIYQTRDFLLKKCINENTDDSELVDVYKQFYRKLLSRNATLPRLNIFSTNYDLYSERSMDELGIHYVNGFTGGISKYFNPAIFNYALAEKMDLSKAKWNAIHNFFYLYKIHGSVNWIEDDNKTKLFKVREIQDPTFEKMKEKETVMIHPTTLKYNASLGSPYSDLFREFQKKLMQNNNILVTMGYSFGDEHINNLIFQAFTIPSFRLIIIGNPGKGSEIQKLKELNESRIWIIGGSIKEDKLHYFKPFVESVLPDLNKDDMDEKMEITIEELNKLRNEQKR